MHDDNARKGLLIETSWEVCNMVGGIYTVLSTKAHTLVERYGDNYILIGPDLSNSHGNQFFIEMPEELAAWQDAAREQGLQVRVGRWDIPGKPLVVLVDYSSFWPHKNGLYTAMWEHFQVDSLYAYGDYDESCMFAYAASVVVESLSRFLQEETPKTIAHYHEWTTAMGLLHSRFLQPTITTIFTTHATCIGRSIAGNHHPLYDQLSTYDADRMADELNIRAKHSLEKQAAHYADVFTTVSEITAKECYYLLGREPKVTPNGFEERIIPGVAQIDALRLSSRQKLLTLAEHMFGRKPASDTFIVATSGRFEFKNKGYDLFLDSLKTLKESDNPREVLAFFFVPAYVGAAREDLIARSLTDAPAEGALDSPFITHALYNFHEDPIVASIYRLGLTNDEDSRVKVIYVPCYLNGADGILNTNYYALLLGVDATVFASYYEPWGYTPHESLAFGVPTITTSLSGFGQWILSQQAERSDQDPVRVIYRTDSNYNDVVWETADQIRQLMHLTVDDMQQLRLKAQTLTQATLWDNFITHYIDAFEEGEQRLMLRTQVRTID